MNEKLIALFVALAVATPVCVACIFGPAALASVVALITGWTVGLDPVVTTGLAIIGAIATVIIVTRRRRRSGMTDGPASGRTPLTDHE